jgi:hypothetical protein
MATFTTTTPNTATYTTQTKGTSGAVTASAGQAMGLLLAFTYSGGQILVAGTLPVFTNQTKN